MLCFSSILNFEKNTWKCIDGNKSVGTIPTHLAASLLLLLFFFACFFLERYNFKHFQNYFKLVTGDNAYTFGHICFVWGQQWRGANVSFHSWKLLTFYDLLHPRFYKDISIAILFILKHNNFIQKDLNFLSWTFSITNEDKTIYPFAHVVFIKCTRICHQKNAKNVSPAYFYFYRLH